MTVPFSFVDAVYAAARWGWYLAVFLVLGAGSYAPFLFAARRGLHRSEPAVAAELTRRAARIGLAAAAALLGLALLRFYLQARILNEPGEPLTGDFLKAVLNSRWGAGWRRQAIAAVLVLLSFAAARRGARVAWILALVSSLALGATTGMTGHAATAKSGPGGIVIDAVHVLAGGWWLGGLGVMAIAGIGAVGTREPDQRPGLLQGLVAEFSRRAQIMAPLAIGLGVWLAARYLGWGWPLHPARSGYSVALVVKLVVLGAVAALGAFNWRVTQPRLLAPGGEARLRRFSRLELCCGLVLLGVTAVLVSLSLPEGRM